MLLFITCSTVLVVGVIQINNKGIELFTENALIEQKNAIELQNENALHNLSILNKAHAYWTDAYENVINEDIAWLNTNLTDYLHEGDFDIDFVYLSNEDNSFYQAIGIEKSIIEDSNLYQQVIITNEPGESVLWIDGEAYFLSGYPIANDDEENPFGVLIIGRQIDEKYRNIILSLTTDVHQNHLFIIEDTQDETLQASNIETGDMNIFYYESTDDTIIYAIHYEFTFVTYIRETMIGHSVIILVTMLTIVLVSTFLLLNLYRKEMNIVLSRITNIDVEQENFEQLQNVKSSEINQIIDTFNTLGLKVEHSIKDLRNKNLEIVKLLSMATEFNDPYTNEHSNNVSELSVLIGEKMKVQNIEKLQLCAKLHDVGKVFLQHKILNKNGEVTISEFDEIKKHPTQGADLLSAISGFDDVRLGVKHHHERFNGTGYPSGLKGLDIPVYARIICVADVYDAITSDRPYRTAFSQEKALKIMEEGRGKLFDPQILDVFLEIIADYTKKPNKIPS